MATTKNTVALAPRTKPEFPPKIWPENYGLYTTKSSCFENPSEAVVGLLPTVRVIRVVPDVEAVTVAARIATAKVEIEEGAEAGASASTARSVTAMVAIVDRNDAACRRPHRMMPRSDCWSTT